MRTGGVKGPTQGRTGPASIGFVIRDQDNTILRKGGMAIGEATVNEAEYSAVICGLYNCHMLGASEVTVRSDSKLIVNQMNGAWAIHEPRLREYAEEAHHEAARFERVSYVWIPRDRNRDADQLTRDYLDK